jgi:crossover junction endodeoxyribonuclease RuvC
MKYILGIDPGLSGAFCLYNPEDIIFFDMPTLEITRNGKKKRQLDLYAIARFIDEHSANIEKAVIENPGAMPGQGSTSMFAFGFNCAAAQMAVAANFIPMTLVRPATWKHDMGLSKDKDATRLKASQMFPQWAHYFSRVKDDGRAEALLIACFGEKNK